MTGKLPSQSTVVSPRCLGLPFIVLAPAATAARRCTRLTGKVIYKDGSVPKGPVCVVRFEPAKDSTASMARSGTGAIGPDGSFELCTRKPGDGVTKASTTSRSRFQKRR